MKALSKSIFHLVIPFWLCLVIAASSEPTPEREWTSSVGTKLRAVAKERAGDDIVFVKPDGKEMRIGLGKLADADRKFLEEHFGAAVEEQGAVKKDAPDGLPFPLGEVVGPVKAGSFNYYLYLPKSLVKDRKAPLLFFTGSGGGNLASVKRHVEGAEVNGWIVAACVESKNNMDGRPAVDACMAHIAETLPVDPKRYYFTGGSGGGVMALMNTARFKGAGAMPVIAHNAFEDWPSKKGYYYLINGATDYNRSASAILRANYGKNAFQRFHSAGHAMGPDDLACDGMAWLNGKFLEENSKDAAFAKERADYEAAMLEWIGSLRAGAAHRALMLLDLLINDYKIAGANGDRAKKLYSELSGTSENVRFVEALKAIDEFANKELSKYTGGSLHKHKPEGIVKGAAKLAEKFSGVPEVSEILLNMQNQTQ